MNLVSKSSRRALLSAAIAGFVIATVGVSAPVYAQLDLPYVIKAKSVVTSPGQVIENASIVVRDGVIEAVGTNVDVPVGAKVLEFENLTVYPGLIESYHQRSFPSSSASSSDSDDKGDDFVELGHENDLIQPERDAALAQVSEDAIKKLRNAGFTLAVAVPEKGIFRGSAVVQALADGSMQDTLIETGVGQAAGLDRSGGGGYPSSLMGSMALFRQVISDARWYQDAQAKYENDPGQRKPRADVSLTALDGVVSKDQPLLFETNNARDMLRVLSLLKATDLEGYLLGNGHEYERLDAIAAGGSPILLTVDFPDPPTVTDPEAASVTQSLKPSLADLRHWKAAPDNPGLLLGAGVTVAFTSHDLSSPADIFPKLATAIERGLTHDQALAGLTTVPAKLFGLERIAGTIEAGKMANFLLAEGELFVEKPKIQEIWVAGKRYELEEIKPPEVNPIGTWTVDVSADGQTIEAVLRITGSLESMDGTLEVMGVTLPVDDVTVSGKTAIVTIDTAAVGMPGEMSLRLNIDGDSATGSGDGPMGTFSFTAKRTSSSPEKSLGAAR